MQSRASHEHSGAFYGCLRSSLRWPTMRAAAVLSFVLCMLLLTMTWSNFWSFGNLASNANCDCPPTALARDSSSLVKPSPYDSPYSGLDVPSALEKRKIVRVGDRDPFTGSYEVRPLEDVLIEMSDYGEMREFARRSYLVKFAWEIAERDKSRAELLRPRVVNDTLFRSSLNGSSPFFSYWNSGFSGVQHPILRHLHVISRAQLLNHSLHDSWSRFEPHYLEDATLSQYVSFPQQLIDKRSNYSTTYFSDLLRVELLASYGGVWTDASFYFQKPMPPSVYSAEFFAFKLWHSPYYSSSWFLRAKKPFNPLLLWVRHFMHEYWKTHTSHAYFDLHAFIEAAILLLPEVRAYYDTMPFFSSNRAHAYHFIMSNAFDAKKHEEAGTKSWGYKLSFKAKCNFVDKLEKEANERQAFIDAHKEKNA